MMTKYSILNEIEHKTKVYPANILNWSRRKNIAKINLKRQIISHNDVSYGPIKFHKKTF
jgi:hypothetical protein